ncbi:uncharacterized protein F4812DRAFT_44574 [Daldinia caldariorum]|uniref:uncharacterized protein n=1 Tax=Daldinia caldariorum TaxID=326644 RepID=UPI00200850FB|nr:uncharacterized protein F4812DRAFT_44574 [Daldinia caldariorum]KAI1473268.1 hypothetical protein F4812DRAFT_44574 [Daldinia caldariorum]
MSEYWKSTPKYWCKHCSTYVRDTKLERQNHEATAKHQGALKRFLRDIHRNHEQEQREKDRAKREIERLNGVVGSSVSSDHQQHHVASTSRIPSSASSQAPTQAAGPQRQRQWEQLAEMGIDVPTELRREMAMAGEWTVTSKRIIDDTPKVDDSDTKPQNIDAIASGVRKRPKPEGEADEEEEEKAIKSLFKKPKKWGRDTKHAPEDDAELDALLSSALTKPPKSEDDPQQPSEEKANLPSETKENPLPSIKKEETTDGEALWSIKSEPQESHIDTPVKQEDEAENGPSTVVFKKRKPKNIRQR